jgi:F-type H+-transporting ATPase subunit b
MDFHFISVVQAATEAATETAHATEPGIAGMFGISWKLFIAQLVNFAIVLLVLWKWVFTPVTRALQKRTARIEESLRTAEKVAHEKTEFEKWKKGEMSKARIEGSAIVAQAKTEAEVVRAELLAKAKQEQEKLLQEGKLELERAETQMLQEAKGKLAELVVSATEKVLGEKLTDKKDLELAKKAVESMK